MRVRFSCYRPLGELVSFARGQIEPEPKPRIKAATQAMVSRGPFDVDDSNKLIGSLDRISRKMESLLKPDPKIEILKNCSFLSGAENYILSDLADATRNLEIAGGETVLTKGDSGSTMYFIASGKVRVHDGEVVLATLGTGEVFGEMAVLDADVRSASVTAETETLLLSLERDDLWKTISQSSETLKTIIVSVLQRERSIVHDVITRTAQVQAFEKELEIGRRIQADFLPEYVPEVENWEITSYFEAAREVAGDFYDVFELKPGKQLAVVIGDVCDKGVGAALFMTLFRSLIRASCQYSALNQDTGKAADGSRDHISRILQTGMDFTNRYISTTHSKSSMFASIFFGVLDPQSGELMYVNAGHESPIIVRSGGGHDILEVTGGIVGLFPFATFSIATEQLNPGDLLLSYTDGVNEAKNENGDQFTDGRILKTAISDWKNSEDLLNRLLDEIFTFRGDAAQSDDITMLILHNLVVN